MAGRSQQVDRANLSLCVASASSSDVGGNSNSVLLFSSRFYVYKKNYLDNAGGEPSLSVCECVYGLQVLLSKCWPHSRLKITTGI